MTTFRVRHRTSYSYDRPVNFGIHRLMVRPRDSHDMRLLESSLAVTPRAEVRWTFDPFGNSVALLSFSEAAEELVIVSELMLRRYGHDDPLDRLARHTGPYPFAYEPDEKIDLGPMLVMQHPGEKPVLAAWIRLSLPDKHLETMSILDALGSAIHRSFTYSRREVHGVQSPARTLTLGSGTCRDFALLFVETARLLGFAARFVTGYLYDPASDECGQGESDVRGGGSTHAWADVFVPGAGWVEFDPTNRIIAGRNLLRVATTRTPIQALPLSGTFHGTDAKFLGMDVGVSVSRVD
jgi:transglutaminase-like putative cysteine protease